MQRTRDSMDLSFEESLCEEEIIATFVELCATLGAIHSGKSLATLASGAVLWYNNTALLIVEHVVFSKAGGRDIRYTDCSSGNLDVLISCITAAC